MIGGTFAIIPGVGAYISAFATGFMTTLLSDVFNSAFDGTEFNFFDSLKAGAANGILTLALAGVVHINFAIKGVTYGRGSWSAITKQIYTKFRRDLIMRISGKTFSKMFGLSLYESWIDIVYSGIK